MTPLVVPRLRRGFAGTVCALACMLAPHAFADDPGRGLTAPFEVAYLKFIADHHYSALRMTELAAGTDGTRNAQIRADEGTSPTPNFEPSPPKGGLDEVKSIARGANRMQREEILRARTFLKQWYGIEYQPRIRSTSRRQIELLEMAAPGRAFDQMFLTVFSRHHFLATTRSTECLAGRELKHDDLRRYCDSIVRVQLNEIDDMRHLLCRNFSICDYQPFRGLRGRYSGDDHPEWQQEAAND